MSLRGRLVVILLAASVAAGAADLESSVYVRGFVSQGYINSEDNNYLLPNDREGSGEFNEAAVTIAAEPAERVHVGIQLLGRDFGLRKTSNVVVDWAYGDFRWRDEVGFRAGKIKLPYGLYNQTRDVDMLRTSGFAHVERYADQRSVRHGTGRQTDFQHRCVLLRLAVSSKATAAAHPASAPHL